MLPLLALSCMRPLPDPLAEQRAAFAALPTLPVDWAPHATLVLGRPLLDAAVIEAVEVAVTGALMPIESTFFGVTARATPSAEIASARLTASPRCESCLALDFTLDGSSLISLENRTGRRESPMDWTARMRGVMKMELDTEQRILSASLAAAEDWEAELSLDAMPAGFNQALSATVNQALQQQLSRPNLPVLPMLALSSEAPAELRAMRLRPIEDKLAVDFAFAVPRSGAVGELPDPGEGWAVVVPAGTAYGLLQAQVLLTPYDPDAPASLELTDLAFDDEGFTLDLRAWPTKGRNIPREARITGSMRLEDDSMVVDAEEAEWLRDDRGFPDLAILLLGDRLAQAMVDALSATLPATQEQEFAGVRVSAKTTELRSEGGDMLMIGVMEMARGVED